MRNGLERIAYVEDDADIRELTDMALSDIGGFEVALYASGAEALSKIPTFRPSLILLDVMMPKMDGPEVFARLGQIEVTNSVPKVFMTAKAQPNEVEYLISMGAAGVIAKPFDPMTLADQVYALWTASQCP